MPRFISQPLSGERLAAQNREALREKAAAALAANATYLALATPTSAQNTAQIKALTRQCNALIRLIINQTSTIADS